MDLVTETDQAVEKMVLGTLTAKYPTYSYVPHHWPCLCIGLPMSFLFWANCYLPTTASSEKRPMFPV